MLLKTAKIGPFKSIEQPVTVELEADVTVFVGMNEAGKTAFLQALKKARSVESNDKYDHIEDYPRKSYTSYNKEHEQNPSRVAELTYKLTTEEIEDINKALEVDLISALEFTVTHDYQNRSTISIHLDEEKYVHHLIERSDLSSDAKTAVSAAKTLKELAELLSSIQKTQPDEAFKTKIDNRVTAAQKVGWRNVLAYEVYTNHIANRIPNFLYFDDYYTLPGKMNLRDLTSRLQNSEAHPAVLEPTHRAVLALLRMADVKLEDMTNPEGYESVRAKLEGISNAITDQVFEFWQQNENLEVVFDIREDPKDQPPFNSGANLYIRIKNNRHRVTVPFNLRSKGFIWFFSFLTWFDSVQQQLDKARAASDIILLLDEPGLSLHALAQTDFLRYIDDLAQKHQVLYTTHSPFMIHSDRLHQVRLVEDKLPGGTIVSDNLNGSDPRTIFPLQAALGYTIAQNLFIAKRNLLVEGPADLIYLRLFSSILDSVGREGLRSDVTIVPVGGLDKLATFVALLGGNSLEMLILHDFSGTTDQRLLDLVKNRIISQKKLLTYADFRSPASTEKAGTKPTPTDVEDLLGVQFYLNAFNAVYHDRLNGKEITDSALPVGPRVVERISKLLNEKGITLRASGGYNHYLVASHLASHPPTSETLESALLERFELLFKKINSLFSRNDSDE